MRSPTLIDVNPVKAAIGQTFNKAQSLNQPVIFTYSWDYPIFKPDSQDLSPSFRLPDSVTPISLLANALDSDYKFYWQQQSLILAAIGAVASMTEINTLNPLKANRFECAKSFCQTYLINSLTYGETALGLIPTYALGGFAFHDRAVPPNTLQIERVERDFPNAMLFIPKWILQQHNSPLVITFNHCIHPTDNLLDLEKSIIADILEFPDLSTNSSDRPLDLNSDPIRPIESIQSIEVRGDRPWVEIVEQAVELIKLGKLEKVVLARALDVSLTLDPLQVLNSLRHNYSECISFLVNFGGASFVGATPEILLQFHSNNSINSGDEFKDKLHLKSDAIAGSTRRGLSDSEDRMLGDILLNSLKDRYEHEIVIRSICDRLQNLGVDLQELASPKLKRLKNIQHLYTEIVGTLNSSQDNSKANSINPHWLQCFEILYQIHPTAAVGGEPQEIAVQLIQESEACDRGWYAAPIGWVNSNGEGIFAVGIRSGYLNGETARIYAGAGIVADSDISSELAETDIKFEALLKALGKSFS